MATLAEIRDKVRRLTASGPSQLTDTQIDQYINTYYLYDFPQQLRILKLETNYQLQLEPGRATYPIPWNDFTSFSGPAYIFGYNVWIAQSQEQFYNYWPKFNQQFNVAGDGTTGPYTATLGVTNVTPNQVYVSAQTAGGLEFGEDDGLGNIIGSISGTIDYFGGQATVTTTAAVAGGDEIAFQYASSQWSRPTSVLIWNSDFVFRAVPDQSYLFELQALFYPTALLSAGQGPLLDQWWQALAFGGAKKILEERMDQQQLAMLVPMLEEQLLFCQRTTLMELAQQRPWTPYSNQLAYQVGNNAAGQGNNWWF